MATLALATGSSRPKTVEDQVMQAFGLESCELTTIDQLDKSEIAISIDGQDYIIDYAFVSNRSENFRLLVSTESGELEEVDAPPVSTIRGTLRGVEVGCVTEDGCCLKVTMPSGEICFVEPASSAFDDPAFADIHVVFTSEDLVKAQKKCGCETPIVESNQPQFSASDDTVTSEVAEDSTALEVAKIALEADFDFFSSSRGGNSIRTTLDLMETAVNFSNEQFERAGIRHEVSVVVIRTTRSLNPWTTSNSSNLLTQLQTYYTTGPGVGTISGDLCHLFTGQSLTNSNGFSIAGTARVIQNNQGLISDSVVCTPSLAFALTTVQRTRTQQISTTFTHELGHNWSLNHCNCTGNIMNTPSNGGLTFTSGSVSQLVSTRNSQTGVDSIGPGGFGLTGTASNDDWDNLILIDTPNFSINTRSNFNATT